MRLFRSTAIVSAMTLVSRVLGFVRDVVLARVFGTSAMTDAFFVAFRIPNLLRRLFAEGSFASGFVPILNEYHELRSREELRELLDVVAGALLAVVTLTVAAGILVAPWIVRLFGWGYADDAAWVALTTDMLRVTFPYALFIALTAMAGGVLNSYGRFAIPALTPALLNIALIAAALLLAPRFDEPIRALAWGVFAAGILQFLVQLGPLRRLGLLPRPRLDLRHSGLRRAFRLMLPTLASSGVYQINLLVDTFMATLIAVGAVSWLYYSDRLLEFPLGVFGIAISTVILPTLARAFASEDDASFRRTLDWALQLSLIISLPAGLALWYLALPLVSTLFQHGAFDDTGARMTGASLAALAAGLPAHIFNKILIQAFFSRQDTVAPMRIAIRCMLANVALNVLFVALLMRWSWLPPHVGLAAASTASAWLQTALLSSTLRRQGLLQHLDAAAWRRHLLALGIACTAMMAFLAWYSPPGAMWMAATLAERVVWLAVCVGGGATTFLTILWLSGGLRREFIEAPT